VCGEGRGGAQGGTGTMNVKRRGGEVRMERRASEEEENSKRAKLVHQWVI